MKKIKLLLWLIILGLVALVVYQNLKFLMIQQTITVNLWIQQYSIELSIGVMMLALFLSGLLISYFFGLAHRFRTRKMVRQLNEELTLERKKVAELESQLGKSSPPSSVASTEAPITAEPPASASQQDQE